MNQNPSINSVKSSQAPALNPVLSTALASLEVQLEQELNRYRRTRKTAKQQTSMSAESYTRPQKTSPLNDIQLPEVSSVIIPPENSFLTTETEAVDFSQELATPEMNETPSHGNLEKSMSSIVHTKIQPPENEDLLPINNAPKQPDDYLESSEALLRSLTAEAPQTEAPNTLNSRNSLLSPMGIGSMLLLLLSSFTLGYIVLNPKNLPKFSLGNSFNSNSSLNAENTEVIDNNPQVTTEPQITPIAKYPNLATQEFRQVRDPKDVVDLTPKIRTTPTITPSPLAIQPPISPISPLPTVSNLPTDVPTPAPKPLDADVKPSANGYYYIIADNQGEKALTAARKVVPDAYLSPNEKFIYLGALKTKDDIKRRLEELEANGIKGRLQEP
jgi:hypothetical protein